MSKIDEKYFFKNVNGKVEFCDSAVDADYVHLPIKEYNGLMNSLRIVRERALQQIDKTKADEHGYRLLRADFKIFNQYKKHGKAWLVTKSTPYAAKISIREAKFMILRDLNEFYNFVGSESYLLNGIYLSLSNDDYADSIEDFKEYKGDTPYLNSNDEKGKKLLKVFLKYDGIFVFEISKLSINYAQGVYEISYWATDLI